MAYIAPNTNIYLLTGVPLDPSYSDTIYFANAADQHAHFLLYTRKTFTNQSYQRAGLGKLRVNISADEIYTYNYLMFQNASYGSKWFYAFITGVEYINNGCAEVTYEIDVMQTYMFDYVLEPCFVERETSAADVAGDNILPEPVDIGDLITDEIIRTGWFNNYKIVLAIAQQASDPGPGDNDGA